MTSKQRRKRGNIVTGNIGTGQKARKKDTKINKEEANKSTP